MPTTTQVATPNKNVADQLLLAIEAEEYRRSLKKFAIAVWPIVEPSVPFVDGWVVDCLISHLEAVTRGDIKKLLINIPPRHSKSTICLIWRAWSWTHSPEDRFLCASYSLSLSIRDNRRTRMLIESDWYQERYGHVFELSGDMNLKGRFENDHRGYNLAVSVGSATTGEGGNRLIIDDMHSAMEAYSDADRETALEWFRTTWSSRLNNAAEDRMVCIGQRIHENDVSGYILRERPDWTVLHLPAYYEPQRHCSTPIGWSDPRKEEGELLWPARFSKETLEGLKRDLGTNGFSAQYQQSPVPAAGGMFKEHWFRYFSETEQAYLLEVPGEGIKSILKSQCWTFGTIDLAISSKQEADYTVMCVWGVTPSQDLLLLHVLRAHLDNAEQMRQLQALHLQFNPDFWKVETVAYQLAFFQQAVLEGVPCREFKPVKDKVSRASTASVWYENGKVYLLKGASWVPDWKGEHVVFPKGPKDDQVDNSSMAADEICTPHEPHVGGGNYETDAFANIDIVGSW